MINFTEKTLEEFKTLMGDQAFICPLVMLLILSLGNSFVTK